jgi:adenylate cyclase
MEGVALERALTLNPNSAQVYSASRWVRFYLGDAETAIVHFNRAIRLSPLDPEMGYMLSGLAHAYLFTERYEEALNYATRSVREWPTWLPGRLARAAALVQLQKLGEAAQEIRAVRDMNPDLTLSRFERALANPNQRFRTRFTSGVETGRPPRMTTRRLPAICSPCHCRA